MDEAGRSTLAPARLPLPIRAMNRMGPLLARARVFPARLEPEALLDEAARAAGCDDFGPDEFREGYERLVASLEGDAALTPFGRFFAKRQLMELLTQRLALVDWRKRHPEVTREAIARPLVVMGLPRTGTTILYGLLAQDPAHRSPLSWEVDDPCPPPEAATYDVDPRIRRTEKRFAQLRGLAPTFQAIHPIGALLPQECIVLTASAFLSIRFEMCFDVAAYQRWIVGADLAPAYRWHRAFLQHLQSRHRRERWVLKSPGHLGPVAAMMAEYPDAMVVQTHRDPRKVVPSVSSLEYAMRCVSTAAPDAHALGRQQLWLWSTYLQQGLEARAALPQHAGQFLDLHFHEIAADPLASVARIYDHFGLALSAEAEARMRAFLAANPRDAHGTHRYTLGMFGLQSDEVDAAFKGYCERFGVVPERAG
ncbi:MAG: sulfotransferase [Myxococcales bacterium]|nr:sulfotransferase [Myxococcales bacterium]